MDARGAKFKAAAKAFNDMMNSEEEFTVVDAPLEPVEAYNAEQKSLVSDLDKIGTPEDLAV